MGEEQKPNSLQSTGNGTLLDETDNRDKFRNYFHIGLTVFLTFVCCILFFFLLWRFQGFTESYNKVIHAAQPIIIGLVLAYLLNPVMKFWEAKYQKWATAVALKRKKEIPEEKLAKSSRAFGVTCSIIFLIIIIALLIAAIVPALIKSISSLVQTLPGQVEDFIKQLQQGELGNKEVTKYVTLALTTIADYVQDWATTELMPEIQTYAAQITSGVISVFTTIANFVIGIVVAVYVMTIQEKLLAQARKVIFAIFRPKHGNAIVHTLRHSSKIFGGFISGKLLDSLIIGIIAYIGCVFMQMPNTVLVSVIIGVTNVIPFFGPIIGAVPTLLLVVIQSPIHALYLLIFIIILQQVDGNIIGPKILGNSTGLSSFWVMFAILVFGGIWGFAGMLLGVPTFAVIYYIIGKLVRVGLRRRNLPEATSAYYGARGIYEESNTIRYTSLHPEAEHEQQEGAFTRFFEKIIGLVKRK